MEDESVTQDTEIKRDYVKARVQQLQALFNEMEHVYRPRIDSVKALQNTTTWSTAPGCSGFVVTMRSTMSEAENRLRVLWTEVQDLAVTLERNAKDLVDLDDATRESLTRLVTRANEGLPDSTVPATPVPYLPGHAPSENAPGLLDGTAPSSSPLVLSTSPDGQYQS